MSRSLRTLLPFLATTSLVIATAACGSKAGSLTGPSPSDTTAAISGTVETGAGAASTSHSSPASAAGFHVSVVNTGLSATTDQNGRFVISGISSGAVTLRFEGPGVDARLNISGLVPGQVLTIGVQVAGSQAVLTASGSDDNPEPSPTPTPSPNPSASPGEPEHQHEMSFKGAVESINAPDLTVAGKLVHTTSATDIRREGNRIALTDLKIGEQVEVEGMAQSDGSILATKVRSEAEDDNGSGEDNGGNSGGGGSDDGSGHD
jgi:uncharacterized protein DUF5666